MSFSNIAGTAIGFFGEGGKIGPDLTGAQRANLDYLLENIVDPSASVAKAYRMQMFVTTDGRLLTGIVESESNRAVTLLTTNDRIVLPKDEVESRKDSQQSIMPNSLLDNLSEQAVRDLFSYLQADPP